MLAAQSYFKLLTAIFVLLWPLRIIFPVPGQRVPTDYAADSTYFKISLSLTMRLISATSASLTHTRTVSDGTTTVAMIPYSLYE